MIGRWRWEIRVWTRSRWALTADWRRRTRDPIGNDPNDGAGPATSPEDCRRVRREFSSDSAQVRMQAWCCRALGVAGNVQSLLLIGLGTYARVPVLGLIRWAR